MRRLLVVAAVAALVVAAFTVPAAGRDRPFNTSRLIATKIAPDLIVRDLGNLPGLGGGQFSKKQIEAFRCVGNEAGADPTETAVDLSCNTALFGQDFAPDNEIAVAVDPLNPDHVLAGSNDYYYRFNNATGARQAIVPTGFFTSFDGGQTWVDGQVPMGEGNGNGDPAPVFDSKFSRPCPQGGGTCSMALMAQLQNVGGQGGPWVAQGDVSVSRSLDGGLTWERPVTVFQGQGAGIGPANKAVFWDKEFIAVDNWPGSPHFGRIYVTATRFLNDLFGSYAESPIYISWSDDGGLTWSEPKEISGSHPSCKFQTTGGGTECDEDQFSYPVVAPDGTVYVHFHNYQNEAAWEVPFDFDAQIMVVKSTDGGVTWSDPVPVVQLEDGLSDMPFSVIFRQTIWGHQIRWNAAGNIVVDPTDPNHLAIVFADRGTANPNAPALTDPETGFPCFVTPGGALNIGEAPFYDPCDAGPGSDTDVFVVESTDRGQTWSGRTQVGSDAGEHEWFPWAGFLSDGTLVVAWDKDTVAPGSVSETAPAAANDTFQHVLWDGTTLLTLGPEEHVDVSVTHWAGQYTTRWPAVCGPVGYADPPVTDAEGKDCNVFHGDYTGLAVDSLDRVHVVWTGLNAPATSPQVDFYTGGPHDGMRQDAMYRLVGL
ncbi:MAG TPA: sialidase family protein [Actinomycetota bacterium]|nr:sialidase family protein [Actinomycetota bacterium]